MFEPPSPDALVSTLYDVPLYTRWHIYYRLQELKIPCWCYPDGSLKVEINYPVDLILVRSTVQQILANRKELVGWLSRCWDTESRYEEKHQDNCKDDD